MMHVQHEQEGVRRKRVAAGPKPGPGKEIGRPRNGRILAQRMMTTGYISWVWGNDVKLQGSIQRRNLIPSEPDAQAADSEGIHSPYCKGFPLRITFTPSKPSLKLAAP